MKLKEFINEHGLSSALTQIQWEAKTSKLIGVELEISGVIQNIDEHSIRLIHSLEYNSDDYIEESFYYSLFYEKEKFGEHLFSYSIGDKVRIIAKLRKALYGSH